MPLSLLDPLCPSECLCLLQDRLQNLRRSQAVEKKRKAEVEAGKQNKTKAVRKQENKEREKV